MVKLVAQPSLDISLFTQRRNPSKIKQNDLKILIGLLVIVIVFHFLILFKIIPFDIVWGGRLKSEQEMYVFESISISMNLFLLWILSLKIKNIKHKFINITLWIFFVIFSSNTICNLFAHTSFEKYFSVLTFIFALLLLKILWKKNLERPLRKDL